MFTQPIENTIATTKIFDSNSSYAFPDSFLVGQFIDSLIYYFAL